MGTYLNPKRHQDETRLMHTRIALSEAMVSESVDCGVGGWCRRVALRVASEDGVDEGSVGEGGISEGVIESGVGECCCCR